MVGTPAVKVTFSSAMVLQIFSIFMISRPGSTCLQPRPTAANGAHQALAWNMGTICRMTVSFAGAQSYGNSKGMEENSSMAVYHALGIACRGRCVAHHGRVPFGKIRRKIILLGKLFYEVVVHDEIGDT